ncbi:hypothetical protein C8P68_104407 [Mucilaginibacter yixingensis]|uniref:Uncharacterized protein n=1 Tax=Mucilaginibacter yixingensis TaxID=1295612 RepID=A0A2T5JA08_9SPHI|nr:hypothetical protein [Mucilaginibacter yixingensis]PTQ96913.1 hypothetical protein C8P68_104407 [Mucilaginibacter yixingensis]
MSPKTFWLIVIKIAGIFLLIQALGVIPQLIIVASINLNSPGRDSILEAALLQFVGCMVFVWLIWACLCRAEKIVALLKLERGFDDEMFKLSIERVKIIRIILLLIGTWLVVEALPAFVSGLSTYFSLSDKSIGIIANPETKYLFLQIGKFIMAYILITCNKIIANWIDAQADKIQYYDPKERDTAADASPDNNA